jgi:outer membrane immunogenic protein
MKRLLIATTVLTALAATAAVAADLPARMPAKAPAMMAAYNWTGFYLGVNLGGAWTDDLAGTNTGGVIGGGQIGYNWQGVGSPWVLGLEADFQGSTQRETVTAGPLTAEAKLPWFGTVRGRLGYAFDRVMVYGTGGFAYQHLEASATIPGVTVVGSDTGVGWTLGGGIEWAFFDRWSAKFEYLYINTDAGVFGGRVDNNVARAGVNYRF